MADTKTYVVHRAMHAGGQDFARGDTRELTEADAAPLVATGALALEGEEPIVRQSGVVHTFGTAPVEHDEHVPTPREPSVTINRTPAHKPAKAAPKPAK